MSALIDIVQQGFHASTPWMEEWKMCRMAYAVVRCDELAPAVLFDYKGKVIQELEPNP